MGDDESKHAGQARLDSEAARLDANVTALKTVADVLRPLNDDETRIRVIRSAAIIMGLPDPAPESAPPDTKGET